MAIKVSFDLGKVSLDVDSDDLVVSITDVIKRQFEFAIRQAILDRFTQLVNEQMVPHEEDIRSRIELELKEQLSKIIVGRRV